MAQVRDSHDSVEVVVVKCLENGYTWYCGGQDISNKVTEPIIAKKLATQTLKLPSVFSQTWSIEETISYLEEYNMSNLSDWQEQPWLKGSLGIILDDNNCFPINGYKLSYDSELGVSVTREDE